MYLISKRHFPKFNPTWNPTKKKSESKIDYSGATLNNPLEKVN
jgi:hypothetical protein